MEVGGYDSKRGAWRVRFLVDGKSLSGLVPEELVDDAMRTGDRPPHDDVYRWLSDHSDKIKTALVAKSRGTPVRAPYDRVVLGED